MTCPHGRPNDACPHCAGSNSNPPPMHDSFGDFIRKESKCGSCGFPALESELCYPMTNAPSPGLCKNCVDE